jgi:hypothetical protein
VIRVENLIGAGNQSTSILLADGSTVKIRLRYAAGVERWFVDVSYPKIQLELNGLGVCVHPNLLRNWRAVIPFGIAVTSLDGADPVRMDDFSSGRISIYVLDSTGDSDDVQAVEDTLYAAA